MVRIRNSDDIILNTLDFLRISQPNLDTKPGTVVRDLVVDGPSAQLAKLYSELSKISTAQSLRFSLGTDLENLAKNFGAVKKRGSKSSGPAIFTFNSLDTDISINKGDIVTANNGSTFIVTSSQVISTIFINTYRANASKFRADLDFVGITDQFAVEVPVEAVSTGTGGNISKYSLRTTSTSGVSNITNAVPFGGGTGPEDDTAFRNRVLSIFSGANTGTSLGYKNAVLADQAVLDAIVIEPGDSLMTRDGTVVKTNSDGTNTIISEGTGGKVDILIFGSRLLETFDSYIFRDLSNKNDPTNTINDFVLGQITADAGKTVSRKRIDDITNGTLPSQPINDVISVIGSISGQNFLPKSIDSLGRITGNYELIKDIGVYGGSPFGFDKLHWISNKISDFKEDKTKLKLNGQDPVSFSDVLKISGVEQNIQIVNENSKVNSSDRTSIQLSHAPITNVTRVLNSTTGERYIITNQNPDGSGTSNLTGRITITGNSLPSVSDTLQIDYIWLLQYDPYFDFDNRFTKNNIRTVVDSIDWGFSNNVRREQAIVTISGSVKKVTVTHPVGSVATVNIFVSESGTITLSNNKLAVIVANKVINVISIIRNSDGTELFNTGQYNGTFNGFTIFLPTDSTGIFNDSVSVKYNASDIFTVDGVSGSFDQNTITISSSSSVIAGTIVECNYIAAINVLLPAVSLSSLPAIRATNYFDTVTQTGIGSQPTTHIFSSPGVVSQNLRQAPSKISLTISGSISPGVITISGTTLTGIFDIVFTVANNGLKQNISSAIRSALKLSSVQSIPSNIRLARISNVEKVLTNNSLDIIGIVNTYDINGYKINDNSFVKYESESDISLQNTEFILPATTNNNDNLPTIGDRLKISFYISTSNDSENISFSKSGTLYTNKTFAIINSTAISSGFLSGSSQLATISLGNLNQPVTGSRYKATYDYLAPKTNERISIKFNQNRLISDATFAVEAVRPINADVLLKSATSILIDISLVIVVTSDFINSSVIVQQNVQDAVTNALNSSMLGTTIDESDLTGVGGAVSGVDRIRSTHFNKIGLLGRVLSISANKNQYLRANNVLVTVEKR